jgi:chromatin segregation and condensation protein Rec8/ScpA/Scc1 (kleisin family)
MLAILELLKATLIEIAQAESFGPLHVRATGHEANPELPLES